jgi:chromosome segregation ATPase
MKNYEVQIGQGDRSLKEAQKRIDALESAAKEQTSQNENLERVISEQSRRLALIPVFERMNITLSKRLSDIYDAVHSEDELCMSIRPLITLSIMLSRWRRLTGTPWIPTTDTRNFWWMNATVHNRLNSEEIIQRVTDLKERLTASEEEGKRLSLSIESIEADLHNAQAKLQETESDLKEEGLKRSEIERALREAEEASEKKVPPEVHEELRASMVKMESRYVEARDRLRQTQIEVVNLEKILAETKDKLSQQKIQTRQKERLLEDAKLDLFEAQTGIAHLKQGNTAKSKDILALERGIEHHRKVARLASAENEVLSVENQHMLAHMTRARGILQAPDHAFVDSRPRL